MTVGTLALVAETEDATLLVGRLTQHLLSVAGAVVTIAGILSLLTSASVKSWVRSHSYWVFITLILVTTAAFVIIDIILTKKRNQGTDHDQETVSKFLEKISPRSQIIVWLKENFISKSVPIKYVDLLDELSHGMKLNVVGLDNPSANQAYIALRDAILVFLEHVTLDLFSNPEHTVLQNSPDWTREDWLATSARINKARDTLVRTYDDFVRTCHKHGLG